MHQDHSNTRVVAIILGGGKGTRLYPLTRERAKPAVPFAGKYRLIDIPMSNCINSGFRQIYILTQFNSASLHNHLSSTYVFDSFTHGFVEILAAEQTFENTGWYEGTADAVRKNFNHFNTQEPSHYIILSGDQLYRMNLARMLAHHIDTGADLTLAATPVDRARASNLGLLRIDESFRVRGFREKPGPDADLCEWRMNSGQKARVVMTEQHHHESRTPPEYLASMGMYVFRADVLKQALANNYADFGKEIIPMTIGMFDVSAFPFGDFWVDIGTIRSFYDTHIDLASESPSFNFYDEEMPVYTHRKHLPPTKLINCSIYHSLAAEGSVIREASLLNSIIGIRMKIESGTTLDGVVAMGANTYETPEQLAANSREGLPNIGIGRDTLIRGAIIDTNARIGANCEIGAGSADRVDGVYDTHYVRDGIIVIPKNSVISDGTIL
jgi:glucose-1-phosphate adenylyltransferase